MQISNWGNFPKINAEIKPFLSSWKKDWANTDFIARGLGRSYGDASLYKRIISMPQEGGILNWDESGAITISGGTSIQEILEFIVPRGFFLPVTPGTKFVTVGGMVAADVHGKNHHSEGTISNFVEQLELWQGPGQTRILKHKDQTNLFNWTCGGMGLTGIILNVTLRLKPIQSNFIDQKVIKGKSLHEMLNLFEENQNWTYSVAWLDSLSKGKNFGRGILYLGEHGIDPHSKLKWTEKKKTKCSLLCAFLFYE